MRSNFSLSALFAAALATLTQAYTTPVGDTPTGNPIYTPGLNSIVPVGIPYAITWDPTTTGTVTLVLLRGPSTDIKPLYPIVEKIPNTGSYSWTPSTSLVADVTHYGIQLIVDSDGSYQYSTQFGISNPNSPSSSSTSSTTSSTSSTSSSTSSSISSSSSSSDVWSWSAPSDSWASAWSSAEVPTSTWSSVLPSSSPVVPITANTTSYIIPSSYVAPTGSAGYNSTGLQSTKSWPVPGSLKPSASATTSVPTAMESSGAVAVAEAGMGLVLAMFAAVVVL